MEVRDLNYFAAIAAHGSVTRASEALGLSPAALSKSLRRLEASVDARLVERDPKGVRLTAAGSALLARIERLRLVVSDIKREASDIANGNAGHVRVGLGQADCDEELTAAYAALRRDAPGVTIAVEVSNNDVMVPRLRAGELDMVINAIPPVPFDGTVQQLLFEDGFVACASADHPLARRRRLALSDLAGEQWALSTSDIDTRRVVERAFRDHGLPPPRVAVEARALRVRLQTWSRTELLGVTSRRLLKKVGKRFRLAQLAVTELSWPRRVGVIYRADAYLPPVARRLVQRLEIELRKES